MECKCAETFAAECGCGSKSAEDAPIPSDPRVSPMDDGLHIPADSPALDLPRENAEIGGVDFKADSSPLPPDPRVSPLNEGLYTPSDTPEMAAESKFDKLAKEIAEEYEEKGKSPKEAMEIGEATAAKIGRAKFGKRKFAKMGKKAEDDIDFDKSKADRNKDGRISDWERAVGNAVSKGIRDHKGAESKLADLTKQDVADIGYQFLHGGKPQSWTDIWVEDEETGEMVEEGSLVDDVESALIETDWFSTRHDTYDEPFLDWFYNDGFSVVEIVDFKSGDEIVTPKMLQDALDKSWEDSNENFGAESAFDRLEDEVADEYEEKGMSDKEAQRIGAAVAYDQGVKKYGKKIMSEAARKGVSARSLERRAEVGPHVPTRIGATTTTRGVVKTFDSIPAGDGHVVGQFTPDMDYAPSGMYGAESITDSIAKGFGSVLGIMSGLIIGGFAMNAVALLKSDDEN